MGVRKIQRFRFQGSNLCVTSHHDLTRLYRTPDTVTTSLCVMLAHTPLPSLPLTKATFPRLLALCPNPLPAKRYTTAVPPPSVTFDNLTLDLFRARLADPNVGPRVRFKYADTVKEAAVLVPLCVVDGKASVLFTLRSGNMRSHKGEIRWVEEKVKGQEDRVRSSKSNINSIFFDRICSFPGGKRGTRWIILLYHLTTICSGYLSHSGPPKEIQSGNLLHSRP